MFDYNQDTDWMQLLISRQRTAIRNRLLIISKVCVVSEICEPIQASSLETF